LNRTIMIILPMFSFGERTIIPLGCIYRGDHKVITSFCFVVDDFISIGIVTQFVQLRIELSAHGKTAEWSPITAVHFFHKPSRFTNYEQSILHCATSNSIFKIRICCGRDSFSFQAGWSYSKYVSLFLFLSLGYMYFAADKNFGIRTKM
jgi:hypothetical protein